MEAAVGIYTDGPDPIFHKAVQLRGRDGVSQGIFHFRNRLPHVMDKFVHVVICRLSRPHHGLLERIAFGFSIAKLAGNRPLRYQINIVIGKQACQATDRQVQFLDVGLNTRDLATVEVEALLCFLYRFLDEQFGIFKGEREALAKIIFEQILPHGCMAFAGVRAEPLARAAGIVPVFALGIL